MFDLDAYLERVGLSGRPDLAEIHRAHVCAIPFENLDPQAGIPVSLDTDALERKLVAGRRGGYCFEQNLLLKAALEALGYHVESMLARVRWGVPEGVTTPRTHMVLRVESGGGQAWLADVGFGAGTLSEPIPFGPGGPYQQLGWRFQVVRHEAELILQTEAHGQWLDVYRVDPEPVPTIDLETSNWFVATHPTSQFVTGLIVSTQHSDGTRLSLSDWNDLGLTIRTPIAATTTPVERAAVPALLAEHFGLPGFELDGAGHLVGVRAGLQS